MLDKARRLTKKRDFMKLATQGRPVYGAFAVLRIRKNAGHTSHVAFITSTKAMKLAVDRNRAKRRMRALLREMWAEVPAGLHLLFVLKPEVAKAEYGALREEVKRLLAKIPAALEKPAKISSRGHKFIKKHADHPQHPKASGPTAHPGVSTHPVA